MKKLMSLILIISFMLQFYPSGSATANLQYDPQTPSIEELKEVLTLEGLSRQFQVSEIKMLAQLNKGYSLEELYSALQSMASEQELETILHELNPGVMGELQSEDYSTDRFENQTPILPVVHSESGVTDAVYGTYVESTGQVTIPDESLFNPSVTSSTYSDVQSRFTTLSSSTYPTSYDELAIKRLNIKADQAPFSINTVNENISTVSGALSTQTTDMVLPGRNGLSFALTRQYNSSDAQYYDKQLYYGHIYTTRYYPQLTGRLHYKYTDFQSVGNLGSASDFYFIPFVYQSFVQYMGQYTNIYFPGNYPILEEFNNEVYDSFKSSWRYVNPDDKTSPVFFAVENLTLYNTPLIARYYTTGNVMIDPFVDPQVVGMAYGNQTQLKPDENRFPIGKGWSWDIPYIETKNSKSYLHLFGGSTYELDGLQLKGYPWKDLTLSYNNTVTVNNKGSNYELKSTDGRKLYFSHDGYLIQISDVYNNTIQFEYQNVTPYGIVLSKVRDAIGNEMSISYTVSEVLITLGDRTVKYDKIKDPQGNKELLSQVTDAAGRKTQYVYEIASTPFDIVGAGRMKDNYTALLKQVYHPTKARTDYTYNAFYRSLGYSAKELVFRTATREDIVTYTDGSVSKYNRVDYTYNGDGATVQKANTVFSTTVNNGRKLTTYTYDRVYIDDNSPEQYYNTQITTTDGSQQRTTLMEYNRTKGWPLPIKTTSQTIKGSLQSTAVISSRMYDDYGNVMTETDPFNKITSYSYDSSTHLLNSITVPVNTGMSLYTELERYPTTNGIKTVKLKENNTNGALKGQTSYIYDAYGNPTTITLKDDNRDITVTQEYNFPFYKAGYPTKQSIQVTNANNENSTITKQFKYTEATGELTEYTDGKGFKTKYEYDKLGRATRVVHPDYSAATVLYDDANNQVTATDETGVSTVIRWNPMGLKISEGIVGKAVTEYGYDTFGRTIWRKEEPNEVNETYKLTSYWYDNWDRVYQTQLPGTDNAFTLVSYDDINRIMQTTDAEGNQSKVTFDILGRTDKQESLNAANVLMSSMNYTYDSTGNVLTQTDAKGFTTSFGYDVLGQLTSVTDPESLSTSYAYSLAGELKQVTYPDTNKVTKQYDQMGRLIRKTDTSGKVEEYYYDANSNLVKDKDRKGQERLYGYNNRNMQTYNIAYNEGFYYDYDKAGRRLWMSDKTGKTQYTYDSATGWLKTVTYPDDRQTHYQYNNQGMRTKMTDPFGVVTEYKYNVRNQLEAVGPAVNSWDITYQYKKNGLPETTQMRNGIVSTYGFNEMNLTSLSQAKAGGTPLNTFGYDYDLNRNQTIKAENGVSYSFTYDKLNRIATSTQFNEQYTYDNRGNRQTLQSDKPFDIMATSYGYDARDRLNYAAAKFSQEVTYRYNSDGLLTERTEGGITTRYYYDGANIIAEGTVTNGVTVHKASYIRGNELVARVDASGSKAYYVHNGHGDVVGLTDGTGNVLNQYTYDMWGNPLTAQETVPNPFRYSGEMWDERSELLYLRARWYAPSVGRFINEDSYQGELNNPLSQNLYTYVHNNPLKYIDPSGHIIVMPDLNGIFNAAVKEVKDTLKWAEEENAKMSDFSWYYKFMYGDTIDSLFNPSYEDAFGIGGLRGPGKKGKIEIPIKPNSIADNIKELSKIASKYGNCQCVDAAKDMKSFIQKNGLKGEQVEIRYKGGKGWIYSDSTGKTISENGYHTGILYEGKVYDNVHPNGLDYQKWIDDFHATGTRTIDKTKIN